MRKVSLVLLSAVLSSSNLVACSSNDSTGPGPDAASDGAKGGADAGGGGHADSGGGGDATSADTGSAADSGQDVTSHAEGGSETGSPDTGVADTGAADTGAADTGVADTGGADTGAADTGADAGHGDAGDAGGPTQVLVTTVDPGTVPVAVTINQGTAIGQGSGNGATPSTLTNVAADPNNTQTILSSTNPFNAKGVPVRAVRVMSSRTRRAA